MAHVPDAAWVVAALLVVATGATTGSTAPPAGGTASVIVIERPGRHADAVQAATRLGGTVGRRLGVIDGFTVDIARSALPALGASAAVASVAPNTTVQLLGSDELWGGSGSAGTMERTARAIGADDAWDERATGAGIDVAVIDSGVTPVDGLAADGKVVNGPDLSFDLQAGLAPYTDGFGHGTHIAGIIAGRDNAITPGHKPEDRDYAGIAPDARIVNVKVAGASGQTDVSQVIAAIDWVVQNRTSGDLNIRVLNLSFGTDGSQDYRVDPLAHAVEVAWRNGIVVVVAAGNDGTGAPGLVDPAYDPYVIAVAADDTSGTNRASDDTVPTWSSRGDGMRNPDVVAPGVSIQGLRVPGSTLDLAVPATGDARFLQGSGTSQAAAVVSGAAALLLSVRPDLSPDQVKALLMRTASRLPDASTEAQGAGLIDVHDALEAPAPTRTQAWERSTGGGSLEAARGSVHLALDGAILDGERDIFGAAWDGPAWGALAEQGLSWSGGTWNSQSWTGACWCATSPSGLSWSGLSWSGLSWSGLSWSGLSWSGLSWSGLSWSGPNWSTVRWTAD
jgi:serine protease AprX